jgi:hypothetical protein
MTYQIEEPYLENENQDDNEVSISPGTKEWQAPSFVVGWQVTFHRIGTGKAHNCYETGFEVSATRLWVRFA